MTNTNRAASHVRFWILQLMLTLAACTAGAQEADWAQHGLDATEQRFSPLADVTPATIGRLGLAWSLDLPDEGGLEATPLEVQGTLYFSGSFGKVYAVDAVTGKERWTFDPAATQADPAAALRMYGVNRGVAFWEGKVYVATRDGRMIALDAGTGKPVWTTHFILPDTHGTSTGAPRVFNGKVIIGNSGSEFGVRGYVTTMDANTGKVLWRFYTVPGDPSKPFEDKAMAMAASTWAGQWWKYGGGGTPWNGITYDAANNQVLIGTGNGTPYNWKYRAPPGKDNLFLSSVVAVDADSGQYKWHYQYNPRESWDWKATSEIILARLNIGGKDRDVMMQAPSNGFFYVIDRTNGKLISAEKYGKATWADHIDLETGRPVERPGIRYENGPTTIYPSSAGAHSWQASAYSPQTGLIYIPYTQIGMTFSPSELQESLVENDLDKNRWRSGVDMMPYIDPNDPADGKGALVAWDPVAGKQRWRFTHKVSAVSGTLVTKGGVVFQGNLLGELFGLDATTGKQLWQFRTGLGIIAPPISYSVGGRQYVSILVGPGGGIGEGGFPGIAQGWKYGLQPRRLLTFTLDGKARLPQTPPPDHSLTPVDNPKVELDPTRVMKGIVAYHQNCTFCHGAEVDASGGGAPDLRESGMAYDLPSLMQVVRDGVLMGRGMPRFADLSDSDVENIFQYIRSEARKAAQQKQ